jgi:chorismate dehydratase
MGEEWLKFTGLPFVYAAWVANKEIPQDFVKQFDEALNNGLAHIDDVLKGIPVQQNFDLSDYFYHKLSFDLSVEKREALNLFLSYIQKLA